MSLSHRYIHRFGLVLLVLLLISLAHSLEAQWARVYGEEGKDTLYSVCQTSSGNYIAVGCVGNRDMLALKINQKGSFRWRLKFRSNVYSEAHVVLAAPDDGCVIAGKTSTKYESDSDIWLLGLDKRGDVVWEKIVGSSKKEKVYAMTESHNGGYVVAGTQGNRAMAFEISRKKKISWQKTYFSESNTDTVAETIAKTSDGGYILAGHIWNAGYGDIWVAKLAHRGGIEWQHSYKFEGIGNAFSVLELPNGNYVVGGSHRYSLDGIVIFTLDREGNVIGKNLYTGSGLDRDELDIGYSLKSTFDGGYILAGWSTSSQRPWSSGSLGLQTDTLLMKLTSEGDIQWQKVYGGFYQSDCGYCVEQTTDGGYIIAGHTCSWGAGGQDGLLLKLHPNGGISSLSSFIGQAYLKKSKPSLNRLDINTIIQKANIGLKNTKTPHYHHFGNRYALGKNATHKLRLKSKNGGTTDPPPGTYYFPDGAEITLKGIADSDHWFGGWNGHITAGSGPDTISFPMDGNKTITATFTEPLTWSGSGGGGIGGINIFSNPEAKPVVALVLGLMLLFILAFWFMIKKAPISSQYSS